MASRWHITEELKEKYLPIILDFIDKVEVNDGEPLSIDLNDSGLSPYTLQKLLEELGYEHENTDTNGWQVDFWTHMKKDKGYRPLCISGTAIIFSLKLEESEE